MRLSAPCLLATASALLVLLALKGVDAAALATCRAAADSDKSSVDYLFCLLELSKHHDIRDGDVWGWAKLSAGIGAANAASAVASIKAKLAGPGMDAKTTELLQDCQVLYTEADSAFLRAHDLINNREYAVGKDQARLAIGLAHQCDDLFTRAAILSPLTPFSSYTEKIGIICVAITNLIK